MPKSRVQEVVYTVMMVIVMVYAMICYNISLNLGGLRAEVFVYALGELPIMGAVAFVLDTLIAGPLAKKLAFRMVTPGEDKPIFVILAISVLSVWLMCPMMSLAAVLLFQGGLTASVGTAWITTTVINFPMAFFWQLFAAGPLVRFVFGKLTDRLPQRTPAKQAE